MPARCTPTSSRRSTRHGDRLDTGTIGTKLLLPVLTEHGDIELAFAIATQTDYPSWGYWITQGATTSWETWSHTGRNQSQNHAFLGTFDEWLYTHLAGIQVASPGYERVRIAPVVPDALARAAASLQTPRGEISSTWHRRGAALTLTVEIPGNTTGEVAVPVSSGDADVVTDERARFVRVEGAYRVFEVGPGRHVFRVRYAKDATQRAMRSHNSPRVPRCCDSARIARG